jgi:GH25 family lysozyme M1 (1,4-beta-N-acetylmuramidase)
MKKRSVARVVVLTLGLLGGGTSGTRAATREFGVDASHYQSETGIPQTNWNQMFTQGNRFVFVKATEGVTFVDTTMGPNVTRATAAGLRAGVYHFAHPELSLTPSGAAQEADYLLSHAGNFIGPGYLRPVLDLESGSNLGSPALTTWVIAFANEIIANRGPGAAPVIYVSQSYASFLDIRVSNFDLWLAAEGTGLNPATDNPATGVFNNWSFWQYNTATAGGISPIDLDVCHSEFKTVDSFLIPAVANPLPPVIVGQPLSRTVRVGNIAGFSVAVAVSSSTPLYYQWRFDGADIANATATAYTQANSQLTNAGNYTVVITNAAGSVTSAVAVLTVNPPAPPVPPVVLYQENFDGYTSPSVATSPATTNGFKLFFGAASGPVDFTARFGFDYSTVTVPSAIPSAPHSSGGTTKGLYLAVNKDATPAAAAVNLYPASQVFTGNFALKFDMWINYSNISASTEHALFGINHSSNVTNRVGQATSDGLFFAVDGDGGVSGGSTTLRDFAAFKGGGAGAIPVLLTPTNTVFGPELLLGANFDNADAAFSALFPSKTLSTFTTVDGTAGNGWVSVEVLQATNVITWLLNDTTVAQYTNTSAFTNGDILIGYNDAFPSIGGTDSFAVFDNIRVETLPDVDGNGLRDTWEIQYFGHTGVDPDADADGDGMSNYQEYLAGTNPTNAASVFRLLNVARVNDDIRLDWTTVGGHSYVAQVATNLGLGLAGNFVDQSPLISVAGATEGTTNYFHTGGATSPARYYRVRLGP